MATGGRTRGYRSELRQRQAAETRRRVVEAAIEEFGRRGYHAATLAQIARRAGVSTETAQKHGPKAALLWAAVAVASFGVEDRIEFLDTDRSRALLAADDPHAFAARLGELMLAINEPVAGVWTAATAAAHGDREVRDNLLDQLAFIRGQVAKVLGAVADRGWLRTDVAFDELVESAAVITSVEAYVRVVRLDGKSHEEYTTFVARAVRDLVLARE